MIILTPSYLLTETIDDVPSWHTRILYDTIARSDDSVVSASTTAVGSFASAPANDQTYEWWQAQGLPATWSVDAGSSVTVNAVGIAAHDLADVGASVKVQYSTDNVSWTDVDGSETLPADNSPIMILFDNIIARYWRLRFDGVGDAPKICVIYIGRAMAMQRPIVWNGHTPGTLNPSIVKRPSMSERGQRIGTTLIREGYSASFEVNNLRELWVRNVFKSFMVSAWRYGYFIAWRPIDFPKEILYGWTDSAIAPTNSGAGTLPRNGATETDGRRMSVSWSIQAHGGYESGILPWGDL